MFQMKNILIVTLTLELVSFILCSCPVDNNKQECNELDYTKYVQCIRKKLRQRRSYNCEDDCSETKDCYESCNDCNCDYCAVRTCESFCSQCCQSTTCTTLNCCHRTCHAQCRTLKCRHECKTECVDNIDEIGKQQIEDDGIRNITTIVTLHAEINNTNVIDVPISINDTTINNQNCCSVVTQSNCTQTPDWPFIKCTYPINQQCGPYCQSPIVHKQFIENCMYPGQCLAYIPQPRPSCIYHPMWPYVLCNVPQQPFCGGCYNHYNFPFQTPPMHCSPACYDEGYGTYGPYYRQGPVYRRNYMHAPLCGEMGSCFGTENLWQYQNQLNVPFSFYPFYWYNSNEVLSEGVEVKDKVSTEKSQFTTISSPMSITVEARINYTKSENSKKKPNKATVAIQNSSN